MVDNVSPLAGHIINSTEFAALLEDILDSGKSSDMDGDELLSSMIASGGVAAVDLAQKFFLRSAADAANAAKSAIAQVDAAAMCVTEAEGVNALLKLRKHFSSTLELHAKMLCEAYIVRTQTAIGLDRVHLAASTDVSKYSTYDMQAIGLTVYQKAPEYFTAWCDLDRQDVLQSMTCRCFSCLVSKQAGNSKKETLISHVTHAHGLANVFSEFGSFVVTEHRKQLNAITADTGAEHDYTDAEAAKDANTFISDLRAKAGK